MLLSRISKLRVVFSTRSTLAFQLWLMICLKEAEAMHRQTLALSEKVLGKEHLSTLASMNNLAGVLDSQGKYKEADAGVKREGAQQEASGHANKCILSHTLA
jgi:hypothetical protein